MDNQPESIDIYGARTNNLKNISLHVPLRKLVTIAGVSGSGKSSLAMGVLYAEGSRRYLEGLSAFTRRKIHQAERPAVERIDFLPPALALRQRPPIPGRRSTVGTITEIYNLLRLIFSRIGTHRCPNGHQVPPVLESILREEVICPVCGVRFTLPSAESFSFNSALGACPVCGGLGERSEVDRSLVVPDPERTLQQGAVASWRAAGRGYLVRIAAQLGVRTNVPWKDLSEKERKIVLDGKRTKRPLIFHNRETGDEYPITFVYDNAVDAVRQALANDKHQIRYARMKKFLTVRPCDVCGGTRLRPEALRTTLSGKNIAEASALSLLEMDRFAEEVPESVPVSVQSVAARLTDKLRHEIAPLLELGVGYLTLDRSGATLSTGERQRLELTETAAARSTGILYILDEPSIGLHPANVVGLQKIMHRMVENGNSLVVVDHNMEIIRDSDYVIEMGPGAGEDGGALVASGTPDQLAANAASLTGAYLSGKRSVRARRPLPLDKENFLAISGVNLHNLHDVSARFPLNRMTAVTGVSGAGKTALVLESLVPAVRSALSGRNLPDCIGRLSGWEKIRRVLTVDSTPIGRNSRSTPATYTGLFDDIRSLFASTAAALRRGWAASRFSFNVAGGRCDACEGRGEMSLDMQYLPEERVQCPQCGGTRYKKETLEVAYKEKSIADVLRMNVDEALAFFADVPALASGLKMLHDVGLGYLRLGEPTPGLSGGEAQRIKLAGELRHSRPDTLYVLDEPSTGLHPKDVETLLGVLNRLLSNGSTILFIDHDPDMIASADYVIDIGPGGGPDGGEIIAAGTPAQIAAHPKSMTGKFLAGHGSI
ncbi:excinuclease ABC subunit UvrA [Sporolactobacillus sp. CQH2019]|uniref:excinuclease ABC subunit UvrA n=1 Tax=Sporolactobacillus sp. CQH2019 TaxID=3023512 RepID=UPI0023676EC2|nr:excinuclease ABC subunit UvrA [Sporolactobacillus sp. CQH2019]MDD9147952.1 excinuclease ABC subunit UvrA [Sporolactobacillus sp. CQH2019]